MNKELLDIIEKESRYFTIDMWWDFLAHFNVEDIKEIDPIKFDEVMQYINSINEQIERWEEMSSERD